MLYGVEGYEVYDTREYVKGEPISIYARVYIPITREDDLEYVRDILGMGDAKYFRIELWEGYGQKPRIDCELTKTTDPAEDGMEDEEWNLGWVGTKEKFLEVVKNVEECGGYFLDDER